MEWASGYPLTDIENTTCVSWDGYSSGSLKIKNTKCDASEDKSDSGMKSYYDKASGDAYTDNLLLRGYLCETRAIHTISAYERMVRSYICQISLAKSILVQYSGKQYIKFIVL